MEGFCMKLLSHRKLFLPIAFFMAVLLTVLIITLTICAADTSKETAVGTPKGQTLYTQFSLFYENNCHRTTNYRKGNLLPVNTEVKFVKADHLNIVVTLPTGQNLKIENIQKYSGEGIDGIFTRTFATKPVDLSKYTEDEKTAVMSGEVKIGMSKSAVILALGYPPKHKTPSLQLNQWQYWWNRFNTFVVHFENEKVTQIED